MFPICTWGCFWNLAFFLHIFPLYDHEWIHCMRGNDDFFFLQDFIRFQYCIQIDNRMIDSEYISYIIIWNDLDLGIWLVVKYLQCKNWYVFLTLRAFRYSRSLSSKTVTDSMNALPFSFHKGSRSSKISESLKRYNKKQIFIWTSLMENSIIKSYF